MTDDDAGSEAVRAMRGERIASQEQIESKKRRANKRAQVRAAHYAQLKLISEMLCESHKGNEARLQQMLVLVLDLLQHGKSKIAYRRALVSVLESCAYVDQPEIVLDGDMLYISGAFDVTELSKKMMWGSTVRDIHMKEVRKGKRRG